MLNKHIIQTTFSLAFKEVSDDELHVVVDTDGGLGKLSGTYCRINFKEVLVPNEDEMYALFEYGLPGFNGTYGGDNDLTGNTKKGYVLGVINTELRLNMHLFPSNVLKVVEVYKDRPILTFDTSHGPLLEGKLWGKDMPIWKVLEQLGMEEFKVPILMRVLEYLYFSIIEPLSNGYYYRRFYLNTNIPIDVYCKTSDEMDHCVKLMEIVFDTRVTMRPHDKLMDEDSLVLNGITLRRVNNNYQVCLIPPVDMDNHVFKL